MCIAAREGWRRPAGFRDVQDSYLNRGIFEGFPLARAGLNYGSSIEELNAACEQARSASKPK
jgi:hypothetical protein